MALAGLFCQFDRRLRSRKVPLGISETGVQADGLAVRSNRLFPSAQFFEDSPPQVVRFGQIWG